MCSIEGCDRKTMYVERDICQMHYFRYMRNGSYFLNNKGHKYRIQNPAGYQKLYEPNHKLCDSSGYVYEHRLIYFNEVNVEPFKCDLCDDPVNWSNLHIDHIDTDVSNNKKDNLRALCRPCNVFRGHNSESMGNHIFDIDGRRMTAFAWSRQDGVIVSYTTILRRKCKGMSDYDCVYSKRITHHNTVTKAGKKKKFDDVRGISNQRENKRI